ncbi:H(+)-transporting V0 sector ATPase subunit a [Phytophthora pseudosyringae]|uniref:V-type proton ATPase subunit a n=1 Tax=Phytophthora pseudosyringae TaxID=221518 RepID=A0A8T1W019_9STRA|nr:H(+)-transporting V0 sector ATPase subunit a [Phytophthora pseudosyringae]
MKWLRSAEMEYISLIVNEDAAHDCVQKLGDLGVLEFTDLNPELTPFQRRYVNYVKRCDEMERKLRYFELELAKFSISPKPAGSIDQFLAGSADIRYGSQDTAARALDTLERLLEDKEQELLQLNSMHEKLTREFNERKELQEIISRAGEFFEIEIPEVQARRNSRTSSRSGGYSFVDTSPGVGAGDETASLRFRNVTGVVPADERLKFERMIFRTTRGNCFTRFSPIEEPLADPTTGQPITKHAFVIFFQSTFIENKLRKICDAFHARLYSLPPMDDRAAIAHLIQSNAGELNQSSHILRRNRESCVLLCRDLAETLESWKWSVLQEKATYHALNMFRADVSGMLRAEGWVIKEALPSVRRAVTRAHTAADDKSMPSLVDSVAKPWPVPPTYFETNKFTDAFQAFVETYGCPRYREVNPSVFTAVTFPFLFGVMYGDIGHGFCVLLFGLYLILTERRLEHPGSMGEMTASIYGGRYMLFMMGAFAMYAGLIYNDFFSLPLNLFGSKFAYPDCLESHDREAKCIAEYMIDGKMTYVNATDVSGGDNVYSMGLDPVWKTSSNELLFFNSFKMKISVIFGIIQMTFGILLKGWNNLYFRDYSTFFFEFVPQIVFAVSLFCYMIVLIVMKWSIDWTERMKHEVCPYNYAGEHTGCRPPSLVNTLINIALAPGNVVDPLFEGQLETQQTLLMMAFVSVPAMLFIKPIYLKIQNDRTAPPVSHHVDFDDEAEERLVSHHHGNSSGGHGGGHGEFEFGEVVIHQGIETIEFVLGMVSNTASYLRLWALSLAHSELATVFWEKTMLSTINSDSFIAIFIGFAVFAATTFGVILAMDVLECFLHALRLHWVEFQNKFYKADGYKFHPFSFKQTIKDSQQP